MSAWFVFRLRTANSMIQTFYMGKNSALKTNNLTGKEAAFRQPQCGQWVILVLPVLFSGGILQLSHYVLQLLMLDNAVTTASLRQISLTLLITLGSLAVCLFYRFAARSMAFTIPAPLIAVEAAMDGIAILNHQGEHLYVNDAYMRLFGYTTSAQLLGQSWQTLYYPEEAERITQEILPQLSGSWQWRGEAIAKKQDGSTFFEEISLTTTPNGIICVRRDITATKRSQSHLHLLERAISASHNSMIITDATQFDHPIIYVNAGFERLTGYTAAEVLGRNARFLQGEDIDQPALQEIRQAMQQGTACTVTLRNYRKDGSCFWSEMAISPVHDDTGRITHYIRVQTDVTARQQAETALAAAKQAAETANQAKSNFLANMSHEIRTPMNAIVGLTTLLLETGLTHEQFDFTEMIRSSNEALLAIINDVLDFSKVESGQLDIIYEPFDLRACLNESLNIVLPKASEKGLELAYLVDPRTPEILIGDAPRLRQILVNLLSNAVKFTEQGEVLVAVKAVPVAVSDLPADQISQLFAAPDDNATYEIQFAVTDTGIGIPSDCMHRLFQSFSQVDASTSRQYGGTGLGLAISKRLSNLMGGKIWVESQGQLGGDYPADYTYYKAWMSPDPAQGSTFYFTVLAQATSQLVCHTRPLEAFPVLLETQPVHPLRILLAEDNVINQKVALHLLHRLGYRADIVSTGVEVLAALTQQIYDVVLLDVQMPEMDGLVAARRICLEQSDHRPRLIAITANATIEDRQACLDAGMDDYVSKPIRIAELAQALERCPLRSATLPASPEFIPTKWLAPDRAPDSNGSPPDSPLVALSQPAIHPPFIYQPPTTFLAHNPSPSRNLEATQPDHAPIGQTLLRQLDPIVLPEIVQSYLEETPKLVQKIGVAARINDCQTLNWAAHTLRSTSALIGAKNLAECCKALEMTSRMGNLEAVTTQVSQLEAEYHQVLASLQMELQRCQR
jgi:PAS domain S-box-containing protein